MARHLAVDNLDLHRNKHRLTVFDRQSRRIGDSRRCAHRHHGGNSPDDAVAVCGWGLLVSAIVAGQILKRLEYPVNYMVLLSMASSTLLVASLGFLAIRERPTKTKGSRVSFRELLRQIPRSLNKSPNLRYFIFISNLLGLTTSLGPFYIVLANNTYELKTGMVADSLLAQIGAMIAGSLLWSRLLKKTRFKTILRFAIPIVAVVPLYALTSAHFLPPWAFVGVFLLGGVSTSGLLIGIDGAFLEITNETNRVLFSGIRGSFNIVSALFPLMVSFLLSSLGYFTVFAVSSAAALLARRLVDRLDCPSDHRDVPS